MNGPRTYLQEQGVGYASTVTSRLLKKLDDPGITRASQTAYFLVLLLSIRGAHFPSGP